MLPRFLRSCVLAVGLNVCASVAHAQWSVVAELPEVAFPSVRVNGDTVLAGADSAVWVSTDAGASWTSSAHLPDGAFSVQAVRLHRGRLYAGTYGRGVYVSDDLGAHWLAFSQGLTPAPTALDVTDLVPRGDSLFVATAGAGVFVRGLSGATSWQPFGQELEPNQASNVNGLVCDGTRLLALAGANGQVFRNDGGESDWTVSNLDNLGLHPGLAASQGLWTGTEWLVGTNLGVLRSAQGQEPWTFFSPGLGPLKWTAFTTYGPHVFAAFTTPTQAVIEESGDDGATWQADESVPGAFIQQVATCRATIFAARGDGLWTRAIDAASVPPARVPAGPRLALTGRQPVGEVAGVRFTLDRAGEAELGLVDLAGRRVTEPQRAAWNAGAHDLVLDLHGVAPGVYELVLTAGGRRQALRLVHLR